MKICMIAEGSYPYITGGVSSWIHTLIQSMPEHEFVIYAIGAEEKQRGKFKYALPDNLTEVHEVFLDTYLQDEFKWGRDIQLTEAQKQSIKALIGGSRDIDWSMFFPALRNAKVESVTDFLSSQDFFDLLGEICVEKYAHVPFTEMFWTVRSMLLPLFQIVRHPVPEADLYHSVSTGYAGVLGSMGKFLFRKPFLLTEHGIYSREREEEIIKSDWVKGYFKDLWIDYFYALSKCAYQSADQVITLFNRNKEIEIELGCAEGKISIIPNGVQAEDFAGIPGKDPDDPHVNVGALVRVVPIKDIKTMLQSFALVKREVPNAKFYVMGPYEEDYEYYSECVSLVDALRLEDVVFTGNVDIKQYIGKMDMLALTSISEGQPLAVLEGMAAGKPFVTTDVGSCKELLYGVDDRFGKAGMIASVMNYEQIGQLLVYLSKNDKIRKQMGENGLARVQHLYSKKQFIEQYKALYGEYERGSEHGGNRLSAEKIV